MRGKYITTSLKLAVLSGSKKLSNISAINAKPSIENFQVIWCKELSSMHIKRTHKRTLMEEYAY